jgi:anaerobic ribonucleoside-triphosphate reductase activating protein
MEIRLHGIVKESITDGPGIRLTIFTQGCPHQCDGCHNPTSHSFTDGFVRQTAQLLQEIMANPLLDGISLSGGEPFMQAAECAELAAGAQAAGLHVMAFTGYTWEELLEQAPNRIGWQDFLKRIDILIDGRFEKNQRSLDLRFRGSRNQRAIDVPASLRQGQAILANL